MTMGILDEIERIDDEDILKHTLKKMVKLEEENQKLLKEILKILKAREMRRKKKEGK
jgi:hypothetical protein